jgi:RNAse (barnase) inhibitor barstar
MEKKIIIIEGHNISHIEEFFDEIQRVLCPNFTHFGRNWNALNDVLRGGFGVYDLGENIFLQVRFKNYIKKHLGENFLNKFERIVGKNANVQLIYSNE